AAPPQLSSRCLAHLDDANRSIDKRLFRRAHRLMARSAFPRFGHFCRLASQHTLSLYHADETRSPSAVHPDSASAGPRAPAPEAVPVWLAGRYSSATQMDDSV